MPGGERDQMGEALQRDRVPVVYMGPDRLGEVDELGHRSAPRMAGQHRGAQVTGDAVSPRTEPGHSDGAFDATTGGRRSLDHR